MSLGEELDFEEFFGWMVVFVKYEICQNIESLGLENHRIGQHFHSKLRFFD